MAARSAKPRFTRSSTGSTRRSSRALVATVVPSRTSSTRPSGRGWPAARPSTSRMAATAGSVAWAAAADRWPTASSAAPSAAPSATGRPRSESSLRTTREPSGAWPTRSVKVPPRSIQNRQPPGPPSEPDGAMAVLEGGWHCGADHGAGGRLKGASGAWQRDSPVAGSRCGQRQAIKLE